MHSLEVDEAAVGAEFDAAVHPEVIAEAHSASSAGDQAKEFAQLI